MVLWHLDFNALAYPYEIVLIQIIGAPPVSCITRTCSSNYLCTHLFNAFQTLHDGTLLTSRSTISSHGLWAFEEEGRFVGILNVALFGPGVALIGAPRWTYEFPQFINPRSMYPPSKCRGGVKCIAPMCAITYCARMNWSWCAHECPCTFLGNVFVDRLATRLHMMEHIGKCQIGGCVEYLECNVGKGLALSPIECSPMVPVFLDPCVPQHYTILQTCYMLDQETWLKT